MSVSRRGFLKFGLGAALAGAVSGLGFNLRPAFAQAKEFKLKPISPSSAASAWCISNTRRASDTAPLLRLWQSRSDAVQ